MDKSCIDEATAQRVAFSRLALGLCTAIPGKVMDFDPTTNLAKVQPAIRMHLTNSSGAASYIPLPVIENVPICLPHSMTGGLYLTVPILAGDLGLIIFSQRAIDNVVQFGGLQNPLATIEDRHHDLTDAMFLPGLSTVPEALGSWNQAAVEIRNTAGTVKLSITATGLVLTASDGTNTTTMTLTPTGVVVTGAGSGGEVTVTGEVTAKQGGADITLSTHTHSDPQGGNTGAPTG
jgi:hypothetical protein